VKATSKIAAKLPEFILHLDCSERLTINRLYAARTASRVPGAALLSGGDSALRLFK